MATNKRFVLLAILALVNAACAAPGHGPPMSPRQDVSDAEALISDGREIAEAQCAGCHAVGPYGDSPNREAPPFRTVLSRYHADVLEQELIEGIQVTHPMPAFQFNPQGVDALVAYMRSIQDPVANTGGESR